MSAGDLVNLVEGVIPEMYHCRCEFCLRSIGELRPADGSYYSRLERRGYYDRAENNTDNGGHVAKTPLHAARWCIQRYTERGDWVLDPTIGAGTTAVEAVTQGRNVAGMELQYGDVLMGNLTAAMNYLLPDADREVRKTWTTAVKVPKTDKKGHEVVPQEVIDKNIRHFEPIAEYRTRVMSKLNLDCVPKTKIRIGDSRRIEDYLSDLGHKFSLVSNNPPYSGDEHANMGIGGNMKTAHYQEGLPNLAFLREGNEYWEALATIYDACIAHLCSGGHFVFAVKDMMRNKKPFMLHQRLNELLQGRGGLSHVGTAFLKHHPTTLFLNTYFETYGVHPPYYQTISVFRKPA